MKSNATKFNGPSNPIALEAKAIYDFVKQRIDANRSELTLLEDAVVEVFSGKTKKKKKNKQKKGGEAKKPKGGTGSAASASGMSVDLGDLNFDDDSDSDSDGSFPDIFREL